MDILFDGEAGLRSLTVAAIDGQNVDFTFSQGGSSGGASAPVGCRVALGLNGGGSYCESGDAPDFEGVEILIVSVQGDTAVLTVSYL
ncbi:hypothetical protein AB0I28_02125 [Phytomonospora sp. NPDC050363]|uniref:hypothetical protein n=1 Tax=Phytomonospora sp. NPDC050363 TaxID=3155642 RepID=UPI0033FC4E17